MPAQRRCTQTQTHAPTPPHPRTHTHTHVRRKHLPTEMQLKRTRTHAHTRTLSTIPSHSGHKHTQRPPRAHSHAHTHKTNGACVAEPKGGTAKNGRSDARGEHEEQHDAGEAVRAQRGCQAAQEPTRRGAPPCDTFQHGMCCTAVQRRAPTKFAALMDARCSVANRNALVARKLSGHVTRKSRCDMLIAGTRLLQHRCATTNDRLLNAQCDIVCCLALQRSTPCCNATIT